jgi:hypothetical protein
LNGLNVWNGLGGLIAPPEPKKRKIAFLVEEKAAPLVSIFCAVRNVEAPSESLTSQTV